jgi:zinc/manganese transport system permease protein
MFSSFMVDTWVVASIVAVVAGVVGFFVVVRGSAFAAHALPLGAFSGAAAASLVGVSTLGGLVVFSVLGALGIGRLGRRGHHDVATALSLVVLLGLGALFLSMTSEYAPEVESLLFGEVLGIAASAVLPVALLGALCVAAVAVFYRPLLLTSVAPELAEARGLRIGRTELWFLLILATTTAVALPVVGALLVFSLMVGPPAAARSFTDRAPLAIALSVVLALATVWSSIALSYASNWPVGFFVGMLGVLAYGTGRLWAWRRRMGRARRATRAVSPRSLPPRAARRVAG